MIWTDTSICVDCPRNFSVSGGGEADDTQLTRQEILQVLEELVFEGNTRPTLREFREVSGIAESQVRKHFGSWAALQNEVGWCGEPRDRRRVWKVCSPQ